MASIFSLNPIPIDGGCYVKCQDGFKHSRGKKLCIRASFATSTPQSLRSAESKVEKLEKYKIGVLGASGYTGSGSLQLCRRTQSCRLSFKPNQLCQNTIKVFCSASMAADPSDDSRKMNTSHMVDKAKRMWDNLPQPVKVFPWNKALENFIQLILDLVLAVIKYLSVPIFTITSISEMSYCGHERKLYLIPLPFLAGVAVAGVLRNAALESSPSLKYAEVPWHLIAVAIFFTLLKFPGPYYPYWGRIFIPHFANGALLRTLWFMFLWNRTPRRQPEKDQLDSTVCNPEAADVTK